jgi:hypothetical protein
MFVMIIAQMYSTHLNESINHHWKYDFSECEAKRSMMLNAKQQSYDG